MDIGRAPAPRPNSCLHFSATFCCCSASTWTDWRCLTGVPLRPLLLPRVRLAERLLLPLRDLDGDLDDPLTGEPDLLVLLDLGLPLCMAGVQSSMESPVGLGSRDDACDVPGTLLLRVYGKPAGKAGSRD